MTESADVKLVGVKGESAPVDYKLEYERSRKQLAELEERFNKANTNATNLEQALRLSQARSNQLEANIKAVRKQRDLFIEREADALVDSTLLSDQTKRMEKEHASHLDHIEKSNQPLRARLHQTTEALTETSQKYGDVRHRLEETRARLDSALDDVLAAKHENVIWADAVNWYLELTAGVKYSVTFRFNRLMGEPLKGNHILAAYREATYPSTKRTSTVKLRKNNIPEFIAHVARHASETISD